jgi:hypothetical protein
MTIKEKQKRIEKSGWKVQFYMNDSHDYKMQATKGGRTIKATSMTNLYQKIFG